MSLTFIEKNVTTVDNGVVAHGVNCQHKMASGVAKSIRQKWPLAYHMYMLNGSGKEVLGSAQLVGVDTSILNNVWVANCYTQLFYGYGGGKYADVKAVDSSLLTTFKFCNAMGLPLYMPRIGCGLGGLNWESDVLPIVDRYVTAYPDVDTYVCDWNPNTEKSNE